MLCKDCINNNNGWCKALKFQHKNSPTVCNDYIKKVEVNNVIKDSVLAISEELRNNGCPFDGGVTVEKSVDKQEEILLLLEKIEQYKKVLSDIIEYANSKERHYPKGLLDSINLIVKVNGLEGETNDK